MEYLEEFREKYGKNDGAYWCAVRKFEQEIGKIAQPHRITSSVTRIQVILRDVGGNELARYKLSELRQEDSVDEEPSEGNEDSEGEGYNPEPEQLEDSSD